MCTHTHTYTETHAAMHACARTHARTHARRRRARRRRGRRRGRRRQGRGQRASQSRGRATVSQRGFPHVAQATVSIRGFPRVLFTGLLRPPAMPEDDGGEPSSPDIGGVPFADAADLNFPATSAFVRKAAVRCMLGARGRAGSTRNRASSTGICGSRMGAARSMHAGRGGHERVVSAHRCHARLGGSSALPGKPSGTRWSGMPP